MPASVTAVPTGGVHAKDVFRFDIAGTTPNDSSHYDNTKYPTEPEVRFYLAYEESSTEFGRSQVFGTSPDGAFHVYDYIFPHAGTWTANLRKVSDNSSVATASVTIT